MFTAREKMFMWRNTMTTHYWKKLTILLIKMTSNSWRLHYANEVNVFRLECRKQPRMDLESKNAIIKGRFREISIWFFDTFTHFFRLSLATNTLLTFFSMSLTILQYFFVRYRFTKPKFYQIFIVFFADLSQKNCFANVENFVSCIGQYKKGHATLFSVVARKISLNAHQLLWIFDVIAKYLNHYLIF